MNKDKINYKITSILLDNINRQLNINIELYNIKLKHLYQIKELELANRPIKIFKSKYNKWLKKMDNINNDINDIYLKINDEIKFIEKK